MSFVDGQDCSPRRRRSRGAGAAGIDHGVPLAEAIRVWASVALHSFGGPAGQIAVMHRFLVEERRWISEQRFLHALNYCMLLPGPEAQQLATYIGWLMHGTLGGVIAGVLFIVPGVLAILALSVAYVVWSGADLVTGMLFGLQAAVVAIVAQAVVRIGRRALHTPLHYAIAGVAFVAIFFGQVAFPVIVAAAAAVGYVAGRVRPGLAQRPAAPGDAGPALSALIDDDDAAITPEAKRSAWRAAAVALVLWVVPVVVLVAVAPAVFAQEAVLFSKSAVVTFGGAYAVLGYLAQAAVTEYGWLRPSEMLTGLGMAETTPGPLIMVVQFVGFLAAYRNPGGLAPLVAGLAGAAVATWITFAPCFLFIFAGAPFIERLRANRSLSAALGGITAAVVGVIANLSLWFALHTWFARVDARFSGGLRLLVPELRSIDIAAVVISAAAVIAIFRYEISVMRTLGFCTAAGAVATLAGLA